MKAATKTRAILGAIRGLRGPVQRREGRLWRCAVLGCNGKPLPARMAAKRSCRRAHKQGLRMRKVIYGPPEGLKKMADSAEVTLRSVLASGFVSLVALKGFVLNRTVGHLKLDGIVT